jgi:hypothetical protein
MRLLLAGFCLLGAHSAIAQEKFTLKSEANEPPAEVSDAIRKLLPKTSQVVRDANGGIVAEFWFREELPGKGTAEQIKNGLTYREVVETCLLGVVKFPNAFTDYRKQEIPAGTYTLRLAYQPETGDHNDTAPHSEFALLCPFDKDTKTDEMEPKTLYKTSFASTGGEHPGVMLLYPNNEKKEPKLQDRGKNVWTLNLTRPVVSDAGKVDLGFAITVAGFSKLR